MKNITLALAIALGFCATEAGAQEGTLQGRNQAKVNATRKLPDNLRAKMTPEEIREYDLWSTWPKDVGPLRTDIVKKCEEEFNVVFLGEGQNEWMKGCGKCLIDGLVRMPFYRDFSVRCWKKFNSDGVLIQAGSCKNFSEYIWMTNRANCVTIENRKKWASEHGMLYEDAVLKQKAYSDALQERKEAVERAEREKERVEMLEELKRQLAAQREAEMVAKQAEHEKERAEQLVKLKQQAEAVKAEAAEKMRIAEEREKERVQREAEKEAERAEREKERAEIQKKLAEMTAELQRRREVEKKQ